MAQASSTGDVTSTSSAAQGLCPVAPGTPASHPPNDATASKRRRAEPPASVDAGLCPLAAEEARGHPQTSAQQLTLRGLNINYPFSQLMLQGAKTIESRHFYLGHRNIANQGEELFLIETPGPRNVLGAVLGDEDVGPPPRHAQVVGTVAFSSSRPYSSTSDWKKDRPKHRVKEGGSYDWDGSGEMHAWHVEKVRRFSEPLDAGSKTQTGYPTPRTLNVSWPAVHASL